MNARGELPGGQAAPKGLFFEDVEMGDGLPALALQFKPQNIAALVRVWTPDRGPSHFDSQAEATKGGFPSFISATNSAETLEIQRDIPPARFGRASRIGSL